MVRRSTGPAPDKGYVVAPVREGLPIPADSGVVFTHRFVTAPE